MITEELAQFIVSLKYEDIPENAIENAKICFIDFLGVSLRGSGVNSSQIAQKVLMNLSYQGYSNSNHSNSHISNSHISNFPISNSCFDGCTVIGTGKTALMDAVMINGISAHCLDLDDGHRVAQLHPGCTVMPAALALAEMLDKNGKEFLEAVVASYETAIVLGMLMNPYHRNQGFHSTGTCGTFAATAAACKLLNLDIEQTINALGIAGTQAAGLLESDHAGTMGKHLHAGKAAQSGILSAFLAKEGFTGAESIMEGKEGFIKAMCSDMVRGDDVEIDIEINDLKLKVSSLLGQFHIQNVYLKKYPVCRHLHSTIDSARDIIHEMDVESLDIDQIENITVQTYRTAAEHDNYNPDTTEAVRQSLPISLAICLLKGDVNLDDVGDGKCHYKHLHSDILFKDIPSKDVRSEHVDSSKDLEFNQNIKKIADKIIIEIDESLENLQPQKRPSRVIITLKNQEGNVIESTNQIEKITYLPKGEPENPFTKEEIFEKFHFLNPNVAMDQLEVIDELESLNIKGLINALNLY